MACTDVVPYRRQGILGETFLTVARFMEHAYEHNDPEGKPDAVIWIVQGDWVALEKTGRSWHVWVEPAFYEDKRQYKSPLIDWIGGFDRARSKIGFCMGRPMTSMYLNIPICSESEVPRRLAS